MSRTMRTMRSMLQKKFREQARLSSLAAQMFARLGLWMPVRVLIQEKAQTASTNGVTIFVPPRFEGTDVLRTPTISVGLLAHELGHFLQPLDRIQKAAEEEELPHPLVNVVLDIQGETMIQQMVPAWKRPLTNVRSRVHKRLEEFRKAALSAKTKEEGYLPALLAGRFLKPTSPFTNWWIRNRGPAMSFDDATDVDELLGFVRDARITPPGELPDFLHELAVKFPWLRKLDDSKVVSPVAVPVFGTGHSADPMTKAMLPTDEEIEARMLDADAGAKVQTVQVTTYLPFSEARRLARRLSVRWQTKAAGELLGTEWLDRLDDARGHPVPYRTKSGYRGGNESLRVVLAVDASGSMLSSPVGEGPTLEEQAMTAAQAVSLAVLSSGGEVVGIVFSDHAYAASEGGNMLFSALQDAGEDGLAYPDGVDVHQGTSFRFLVDVWRQWPTHRVVVFTDGIGFEPAPLERDRERTAAVLFGPARELKCAGKNVRIDSPEELPYVLGLLVPRRTVAT